MERLRELWYRVSQWPTWVKLLLAAVIGAVLVLAIIKLKNKSSNQLDATDATASDFSSPDPLAKAPDVSTARKPGTSPDAASNAGKPPATPTTNGGSSDGGDKGPKPLQTQRVNGIEIFNPNKSVVVPNKNVQVPAPPRNNSANAAANAAQWTVQRRGYKLQSTEQLNRGTGSGSESSGYGSGHGPLVTGSIAPKHYYGKRIS
jgi:hypothetical protein